LNGAKKLRRPVQFTLRWAFAVLTFMAVAIVFAPKLWNARLTAPPRIDVRNPGSLDLAGERIRFPVKPENVVSYYCEWDGGTYAVHFSDNAGVPHLVASWRPLGQPEHHGDILIGGISPRDGGMNVGKIEMAERLIFSILELEEQGHQSRSEVMDNASPTNGLLLARIVRHLAGWVATVR